MGTSEIWIHTIWQRFCIAYFVFRDTDVGIIDVGIIDIDVSRMLDTIGDVVDWLETERTEKQ